MRSWRLIVLALPILTVVIGGFIVFENVCATGGGSDSGYQVCGCLGYEFELYDQTSTGGPRRTICVGVITRRVCVQYRNAELRPCAGTE